LALAWLGIRQLFYAFALPWVDWFLPALPGWTDWVGLFAAVLAGIGLALGLALLIAPVTALIASLFLDDVAEAIERSDYPVDPPGSAMPLIPGMILSIKFFGIVILGNLLALVLLLVPGVNIAAFF